jgi:hypothetical protein
VSSPAFSELLERRLSRRDALKAGAVLAAGVAAGPLVRSHPAGADAGARATAEPGGPSGTGLGFNAIEPTGEDKVVVPDGYDVCTLISWGDPLRPGLGPFDSKTQSASEQQHRFGFSNDFVAFFPLPPRPGTSDRALLWVNHEFSLERMMFFDWDPKHPEPEQVAIAQAAVGGTVVEIIRDLQGVWSYDQASPHNRRVTAHTAMHLTGPAAGSSWLRTKADPTGRCVLGTLANCAGGVTPWGTVLSGEENFDWYFNFGAFLEGFKDEATDGRLKAAHKAYYKRDGEEKQGRHRGWHSVDPRFNLFEEPNEPFRFGWIVEVDPYDPSFVPRKRTALGRFKHEGAATTLAADDRAVVYSGEDEECKFVYKFVSRRPAEPRDPRANRDLLDDGTLYAARFADDGTGEWLPLVFGTGPLRPNVFTSQADVLVRARQAAEVVGATQMDRPEDIEVSPVDGRVYLALTKNPDRKREQPGGANPRRHNEFGHVIELTEARGDAGATSFRWDVFLLCGDLTRLVTDLRGVDFSKDDDYKISYFAGYGGPKEISPIATPDNLAFDLAGNLWIATDGQGDKERLGEDARDALHAVPTWGCERGRVRQFLSAVKGAEVTGPCFSAANDALFVSIQHPGRSDDSTLTNPTSRWPDGDGCPPRPGVVVVTKHDGGSIGS